MYEDGTLYGGAQLLRKYKLGATMANPGIVMNAVATAIGVIPCTTTSFADSHGLAIDAGSYTTTQATVISAGEGLVTVSSRPDLIIRARIAGSATEGVSCLTGTITSADTAGTTLTATVSSNDMDGGTVWFISGNNVGQSRSITTHTSTTSFTVTVPFPRTIAVGDVFGYAPYNVTGTGAAGGDGIKNVQTTTVFTEADGSIAAGTGGEVCVVDLDLGKAEKSYVKFVLRLHVAASATIAS